MYELSKEDRDKVIEWLVEDDQFNMSQDNSQLVLVLYDGFVGYNSMTDEDLVEEYYQRTDSEDPINLNL